jgi:hypothetical protein
MGIEIDDELEVAWNEGSARDERVVWVVFTDRDGTPFVTADRSLLDTRVTPMPFHFGAGVLWPLIDGDRVTRVRKARSA